MTLTASERAEGWVEFLCPTHGFLVATTVRAEVRCKCSKTAAAHRDGKPLHRETLRRLKASQTPT